MEITAEVQALLDAQKAELQEAHKADIKGLKDNVDTMLTEKAEWKRVKDAAIEKAAKEALDKAKAEDDTKAVTASYDEIIMGLREENNSMKEANKVALKSQVASDFMIAVGATGAQLGQDAMKGEYLQRIDIRDGKTVVLDAQGNLTALSIEDLDKEFSSNARYSEYIKGTGAIGGGATGNKSGGAAHKKPKEMTASERLAFKESDPIGFKRAFNL